MTVARLLLDSTALIGALRGRPAAARLARLRRKEEPWVCDLGRGGLAGIHSDEEPVARRLFAGLRVAPPAPPRGSVPARAARFRETGSHADAGGLSLRGGGHCRIALLWQPRTSATSRCPTSPSSTGRSAPEARSRPAHLRTRPAEAKVARAPQAHAAGAGLGARRAVMTSSPPMPSITPLTRSRFMPHTRLRCCSARTWNGQLTSTISSPRRSGS